MRMTDLCEKCKNKDTRQLQDNFNRLYMAMSKVAEALEIDESDWLKRVDRINRWAIDTIRKRSKR